jgi:hypothetical protein
MFQVNLNYGENQIKRIYAIPCNVNDIEIAQKYHHTNMYTFTHFHIILISLFLFSLSLFSAPNNFKGLLLRSHVLYRLKHYQSSLADVENAIKSRPTSYKVSLSQFHDHHYHEESDKLL